MSKGAQALSYARQHWPRLLLSVVVLAVVFGNQGFRSLVRNYLELRSLRQELGALEDEHAKQAQRLKLLREGGASVERIARRELGYIKQGEIEYRFPPPAPEE